MSGANEYPLGGDLTDDRVSGLLHTTLERLANRTAAQNNQLTQIFNQGDSIAIGNQTFAPSGSDWRDAGQGDSTRKKVTDIDYCCYKSTWVLYTASIEFTATVTNTKYKSSIDKYRSGYRARNVDGSLKCQTYADRHRGATELCVVGAINPSIEGQFRGIFPGGPGRKITINSIALDIKMKAEGIAPGKKIKSIISIHNTICDDFTALIATLEHEETENTISSFAPQLEVWHPGTAKSQQYDPQHFSRIALGEEWRGGDLFVMDVKIYTDDTSSILTNFCVGIGELRLDLT